MIKLYKLLRDPFQVVSQNKTEFAIWFIFTIIAGQLGIIANIIIRFYSQRASIQESILIDSINGSFYTFSIALVASILGPLFINLVNSKKLQFKTIKILTIIFSVFFLFFSGIVYAVIQSQTLNNTSSYKISIDITQLTVYLLSIIFVTYSFCILRLEQSPNEFSNLDDPLFSDEDNKKVNEVIDGGKDLNDDGEGVKL